MRTKILFVGALAIALFAALLLSVSIDQTSAAPLPAPTPVSVNPTGAQPRVLDFFSAETATADVTSSCIAVDAYEKADVYYSLDIDAANVNTTTIYLQFGNSVDALVNGVAIASAVAADGSNLNQYQLFGRYFCIKADTTDASTGTITVTVNALVR